MPVTARRWAAGGNFNQVCGDWSGYAQQYIEDQRPGAVAMITIGCQPTRLGPSTEDIIVRAVSDLMPLQFRNTP